MSKKSKRSKIIIAWYYAGDDRKHLLFPWQDDGWQGDGCRWGSGPDASKAVKFGTPADAARWWLAKHTFPEDYRPCLYDGTILFFELNNAGMNRVFPFI